MAMALSSRTKMRPGARSAPRRSPSGGALRRNLSQTRLLCAGSSPPATGNAPARPFSRTRLEDGPRHQALAAGDRLLREGHGQAVPLGEDEPREGVILQPGAGSKPRGTARITGKRPVIDQSRLQASLSGTNTSKPLRWPMPATRVCAWQCVNSRALRRRLASRLFSAPKRALSSSRIFAL